MKENSECNFVYLMMLKQCVASPNRGVIERELLHDFTRIYSN
jgi:hypothetical protein